MTSGPFSNGSSVLFGTRTGAPWRDLPEGFGRWSPVYRQFRRRTLAGPLEDIPDAVRTTRGLRQTYCRWPTSKRPRTTRSSVTGGGIRAVQEVGSRQGSFALCKQRSLPDENREDIESRNAPPMIPPMMLMRNPVDMLICTFRNMVSRCFVTEADSWPGWAEVARISLWLDDLPA